MESVEAIAWPVRLAVKPQLNWGELVFAFEQDFGVVLNQWFVNLFTGLCSAIETDLLQFDFHYFPFVGALLDALPAQQAAQCHFVWLNWIPPSGGFISLQLVHSLC
jgi:hypothetical protein